jgi:hypothetical protein
VVTDRECPFAAVDIRSAAGACSTDLPAAVKREVLGLGSQERYPREYSESIWSLEGLLDSGPARLGVYRGSQAAGRWVCG